MRKFKNSPESRSSQSSESVIFFESRDHTYTGPVTDCAATRVTRLPDCHVIVSEAQPSKKYSATQIEIAIARSKKLSTE